jgi:hypothetical protein
MVTGPLSSALCLRDFVVNAFSLTLTRHARPRMKAIVSLAHVQVSDVRINFGGGNVRVTQQRLHRTRIRAVLH